MSLSLVSTQTQEVKVSPAPAIITLAGKVAIVTGASRGIGRGIALALARDGAKVVVNYQKDSKSADAVVAAIKTISGGAAIAIQADVSISAEVDRLFAEAKRVFGRIDIVIANSGVTGAGLISLLSDDDFTRVFDINVKGAFYTLRAAANLVENNGRIMVIGSILKVGTMAGIGAYAATKAAVEVLANTLAQELGSKGITVNSIHPGGVDTDMMTSTGPEFVAMAAGMSPLKRLGTINDIGDSVALLASESARWISGQSIVVAGGAK